MYLEKMRTILEDTSELSSIDRQSEINAFVRNNGVFPDFRRRIISLSLIGSEVVWVVVGGDVVSNSEGALFCEFGRLVVRKCPFVAREGARFVVAVVVGAHFLWNDAFRFGVEHEALFNWSLVSSGSVEVWNGPANVFVLDHELFAFSLKIIISPFL